MPKVEVRGNDLRHAIIKFKRTCEKGSKKRPREDARDKANRETQNNETLPANAGSKSIQRAKRFSVCR